VIRAILHLLFWLSLIPFVTSWIGEEHFVAIPMSCYGIILLICAFSNIILQNKLYQLHSKESILKEVMSNDKKGKLSLTFYILAIPLAFVSTWISGILFIAVALIWIVPDKRIERQINKNI
jgi:uncharacterized membrane protein